MQRYSTTVAPEWFTNEECNGSSSSHPKRGNACVCRDGRRKEGGGRLSQLGQCHGKTTWTTS